MLNSQNINEISQAGEEKSMEVRICETDKCRTRKDVKMSVQTSLHNCFCKDIQYAGRTLHLQSTCHRD